MDYPSSLFFFLALIWSASFFIYGLWLKRKTRHLPPDISALYGMALVDIYNIGLAILAAPTGPSIIENVLINTLIWTIILLVTIVPIVHIFISKMKGI
jgi:hypothetical protein